MELTPPCRFETYAVPIVASQNTPKQSMFIEAVEN
jgi:hypothetical protein